LDGSVSFPAVSKQKVLFYKLPAQYLQLGVSTDDGQDVIAVQHAGKSVFYTCCTPRPDDPDADAYNRSAPETRFADRSRPVDLAVFEDTEVDLSKHPEAQLR
jgi:hypothetical protein